MHNGIGATSEAGITGNGVNMGTINDCRQLSLLGYSFPKSEMKQLRPSWFGRVDQCNSVKLFYVQKSWGKGGKRAPEFTGLQSHVSCSDEHGYVGIDFL